ncbi:MAG: NfeD family protein [Bacillota bacterium]|nr:NfeD family protein [Bacillota bacterium]
MAVFIWSLAIIVFAAVEAATAQLVSIWFVIGSVGGLVGALLGAAVATQIIIFIVISLLVLIFTRPLVKKIRGREIVPTNADSLIGKVTVVTQDIDPIKETGTVKLSGIEWSAKSIDGSKINAGELVKIRNIEGVKLIVNRQEE